MEDDIKRWTAKRKTALILDIIQGKTTVAEASRAYDLPPSEIEEWVRKLPRQVDSLEVETSALNTRGLNWTGGTSPRDSCGRYSL